MPKLDSYAGTSATAAQFARLAGVNGVTLLNYGGDNTGVNDNSLVLAQALASGKPVCIGPGTWRFNTPVTLAAGQILYCEGSPTLKFYGAAGAFNNLGGFNLSSTGATIFGPATIDMANVADFPVAGVQITGASCLVYDVSTTNANYNSFHLLNCIDAVIRHGFCPPNKGPAINMDGCVGCTVADFDLSGVADQFGVFLTNAASKNTILNVRCYNTIANPSLELIGLTFTCFMNRIEGCHAEGTGDNGMTITGFYNTVVNNTAFKNANFGIAVLGRNNTVQGNVCGNNSQSGAGNFPNIGIQPSFGGEGRDNTIIGNACFDDQATPTASAAVATLANGYNGWVTGHSFSPSNPYCFFNNGGVWNVYRANSLSGPTNAGTTAPTWTNGTQSDGVIAWTYLFTAKVANLDALSNLVIGNSARGHQTTDGQRNTGQNPNIYVGKDSVSFVLQSADGVTSCGIHTGANSPNGVVAGNLGDIYLRNNGNNGIAFYTKENGAAGSNAGWSPVQGRVFGTTAQRPNFGVNTGFSGYMYFDTTINKPVWWNATGNGWVDATGTAA